MLRRLNQNEYKDEQYEIEVQHIGGERRFVPITVITEHYITITWGQSGAYDVYLSDRPPRFAAGYLYARSMRARRKAPCLWKVADFPELKRWIHERYHRNEEQAAAERDKQHHATMPIRKAGQYRD